MKPPVENVRVSRRGRDQLMKIRRGTGIENWNTICRWALCASLREPSIPPIVDKEGDNPVELSWKTFAGEHSDALIAALALRFSLDSKKNDKIEESEYFRRHLYRGLNFLDARLEVSDGFELFMSLLPDTK